MLMDCVWILGISFSFVGVLVVVVCVWCLVVLC